MGLVLNLTKITPPAPLPDGTYHVKILEATEGQDNSGNFTINLKLQIHDGEFEGRVFWDTLTFILSDPTDFRMIKAKELIILCGVDPESEEATIGSELFLGEVHAVKVRTNLKTKINPTTGEPYEPRPQVQKWLPYGSAQTAMSMLEADEDDE